MSNRHNRRASVADFRKRVGGTHLVTYLLDDIALIDGHRLLGPCLRQWLAACEARRPYCIGCKKNFMDGAEPGAFLFATSPGASGDVSVSALCTECWALPLVEIEAIATRALRKLLPHGRFA